MKILTSSTPKILLVDDNHDGLLVRRSFLEEIGYCVQIASNGEEGLKLFESANLRRRGDGLSHAVAWTVWS